MTTTFCTPCSIHNNGCDNNLLIDKKFIDAEALKDHTCPSSCDLIYIEDNNSTIIYIEHKWVQYFFRFISGKETLDNLRDTLLEKLTHSYFAYKNFFGEHSCNTKFILFYSKKNTLPNPNNDINIAHVNDELIAIDLAYLKSYFRKLILRMCKENNNLFLDSIGNVTVYVDECSNASTYIS